MILYDIVYHRYGASRKAASQCSVFLAKYTPGRPNHHSCLDIYALYDSQFVLWPFYQIQLYPEIQSQRHNIAPDVSCLGRGEQGGFFSLRIQVADLEKDITNSSSMLELWMWIKSKQMIDWWIQGTVWLGD